MSLVITKWYLDCVDASGDLAIAYWLRVRWGELALTAGSMTVSPDSDSGTRSRFGTIPEPHLENERISWSTMGLDLRMAARTPSFQSRLLETRNGSVDWHCVMPSSDASLRFGDRVLQGRGYAEVLSMSIAPWKLPIDELRWGRFAGDTAVVWIDWRGGHPLTLVIANGVAVKARVGDHEVNFDSGDRLLLDQPRVICDRAVGDALTNVAILRRGLPSRLANAREQKWVARGSLFRGGSIADRGWAVHEVVKFV